MKPKKDQALALTKIKKWFNKSPRIRSDYMVMSGYAGTGKSTLLSWIEDELKLKEEDVIFSAFTGKATSVLKRQGLRAKTLHRLLYKHKFNKKTGTYYSILKPEGLEESLVVVDEASMLSKYLFDDLMKIYGHFKILFVGDDAQLPPVDSTFNIMQNPDIRLTKVLRQAALNPIVRLATKIRNGEDWKIECCLNDGLGYMPVTEDVLEESINNSFQNDVFLCSTNKDRVSINQNIRNEILSRNKKSKKLDVIYAGKKKKDGILHEGDRVIILDNCKKQGVFNGQLFTVSKFRLVNKHKIILTGYEDELENKTSILIHPHNFLQPKMINRFELSKKHKLDFKEMGVSCDYAYCLTVHKSQGSEFNNVFLQLRGNDRYIWGDLYNRWLYTAITRASKNLYFV